MIYDNVTQNNFRMISSLSLTTVDTSMCTNESLSSFMVNAKDNKGHDHITPKRKILLLGIVCGCDKTSSDDKSNGNLIQIILKFSLIFGLICKFCHLFTNLACSFKGAKVKQSL